MASPHGETIFHIYNPPLVDEKLGIRRSDAKMQDPPIWPRTSSGPIARRIAVHGEPAAMWKFFPLPAG